MKIIDIPQSGRLGTFITFKTRYGQVRRPYVIPKNPRTTAQVGVRSRFGRVSALWRTLTEEQRAAWKAAGAQVRSRGRGGASGPLSGFHFFVKINTNLFHLGEPLAVDPPNHALFGANPVAGVAITNAGGVVAVKLSVPAGPAQRILVSATAPTSAGVSFPGRFVCLGELPAREADISDITDLYVARFGVPPANARIFIQTQQQMDGWKDLPKRTSAVVPTA
jgi:hypothetical protein